MQSPHTSPITAPPTIFAVNERQRYHGTALVVAHTTDFQLQVWLQTTSARK